MSWAAYTDAAQQLAAVRRDDAGHRAGVAATARTVQADIDRLTARLAAQRTYLTELARQLRLPAPSVGKVGRSSLADIGEALHRADDAANRADVDARGAEQRATQPPLLPGLPPTARNAIVYAAAAVLASLASCALWTTSPSTDFGRIPLSLVPWSVCGLPALAFFTGYLTLVLGGQPRIPGEEKISRQPLLGGAICFVGMPVAWFLFIAMSMA